MNNEAGSAVSRRQKWILIALVVLFLSPIVGSYLLFNYTSLGQGGGGASHGTLIQPPRQLPDLVLREAGSESQTKHHLYGKWSLIYLVDGRCDNECARNLYRMRQLRLAQGRDGTRVQRILINVGEQRTLLDEHQLREYSGQLIAEPDRPAALLEQFRIDEDRPLSAGRLYLVDPRGFLMMSYAPDTDPGGIIDDMKRLLRYSRVG